MINLPEKIKNDLEPKTFQLEYLLEIETDPIIRIGTSKLGLEGDVGQQEQFMWSEDLIAGDFFNTA